MRRKLCLWYYRAGDEKTKGCRWYCSRKQKKDKQRFLVSCGKRSQWDSSVQRRPGKSNVEWERGLPLEKHTWSSWQYGAGDDGFEADNSCLWSEEKLCSWCSRRECGQQDVQLRLRYSLERNLTRSWQKALTILRSVCSGKSWQRAPSSVPPWSCLGFYPWTMHRFLNPYSAKTTKTTHKPVS